MTDTADMLLNLSSITSSEIASSQEKTVHCQHCFTSGAGAGPTPHPTTAGRKD